MKDQGSIPGGDSWLRPRSDSGWVLSGPFYRSSFGHLNTGRGLDSTVSCSPLTLMAEILDKFSFYYSMNSVYLLLLYP